MNESLHDRGLGEKQRYRPDIDGLRAVSILLVVAFHAFPGMVSGGFIGVDIFFVISGYLITRIILVEISARVFSLHSFYARRIRRIFPALIIVLAVTYGMGWVILLPREFATLGQNMVAGVGFFSNLFQLWSLDYFAPDAAENPLLHLWSLGIEEQYYIFWPLLLISVRGRGRLLFTIAVIGAVSFAFNLWTAANHHELAFYSPISRAWELLAGGFLSAHRIQHNALDKPAAKDLKAVAGLALVISSSLFLNPTSAFPGWNALFPVAGAALLLDAEDSFFSRKILASRPMVAIGLISYPLYLWHWPLLSYLQIVKSGSPTALENTLACITAGVLAWATYRGVELPLRRLVDAPRRLAVTLACLGGVGLLTIIWNGFEFRFSPEILALGNLHLDPASYRSNCFLNVGRGPEDFNESCVEAGRGPLIFLWGDSTAANLYSGLKSQQSEVQFHIAQFTASACPPILAYNVKNRPRCEEINDAALGYLIRSKPDVVIMQGLWNTRLDFDKLRATIKLLRRSSDARIVLVGPVPSWKRPLPAMALNAYRIGRSLISERIKDDVDGEQADSLMTTFSSDERVEYFSAWNALCNQQGCAARVGPAASDLSATDYMHLTSAGSKMLAASLIKTLFPQPNWSASEPLRQRTN
jgi:peptidoglycan/LPS O-acetylase OafA/YrhL